MIISLINLFAGYLTITLLGWTCLDLFRNRFAHKLSSLLTLSISFLLGATLINIVFTAIMISGANISHQLVFSAAIISLAYFIFRVVRSGVWKRISLTKYMSTLKLPLNLLLIAFISTILLHNLSWPVTDWDALTLYDFRGRVFSENIRIEDFRNDIHDTYSNFDYYYSYPFMTSSLHAWSYILGASTPMIVYFGFYLSLVLLFYEKWGIRSGKPKLTHLFPLILAASPELFSHSTIAYTNLPYTIFFFFSIYFLIDKKNYSPTISTLMLLSSFFTRSLEPFWLITISVMLYQMVKRKSVIKSSVLIALFFLSRYLWTSYAVVDLTNKRLVSISLGSILANFNLKELFQIELFLVKNYLTYIKIPTLLAALAAFLTIRERKRIRPAWLIIFTLGTAILLGGGYIFAQKYTVWSSIGPSAARMMLSFTPLLMYFAFTHLADYLNEKK